MIALIVTLMSLSLLAQQPGHTQIVLLGTGNPAPDPERSGPATAIVVNDTPYLVDFGAGVVRRAEEAAIQRGIKALEPTNLLVAFVTHLHSDHTVGYADLILTPWVTGRKVPLQVYGPAGIKEMTEHLLEAYRADFETRTNRARPGLITGSGGQIPEGHTVEAHQIHAGVVYKDVNVTVTAFPTKHAMESFGYRFDTPDRSIVISGDTNPTQATIDACHGCDVLIHEVLSLEGLARRPAEFQSFASKYHTTTAQLAELASQAKPRLLIIYHVNSRSSATPQASTIGAILGEMSSRYSGTVVVGRDLDVY